MTMGTFRGCHLGQGVHADKLDAEHVDCTETTGCFGFDNPSGHWRCGRDHDGTRVADVGGDDAGERVACSGGCGVDLTGKPDGDGCSLG